MEENFMTETCACSSLDWAGFDLTAPHHPNCDAFVAARARLTDLPAVDGLRILVNPAAPAEYVIRADDLEAMIIRMVQKAIREGRGVA
jgi:hypothetical protein